MTELLFVGPSDETLTKFMRLLRARAPGWSVLHCADADSALACLGRRSADIVLARFGTASECEKLFARVSESNPDILRLALFDSPPLRVRGAHQCVASRGDFEDLHATLRAAAEVSAKCALKPGLRNIVSRFQDVPSPPLLYFEIREQLDCESGTASSMAEIASRDPALVARTLKMANSGYYASPRSVGDLTDAIRLLGGETLLALVMAAHLFTGLPPPGMRLDALWQHAFEVSTLAREISRIEGGDRREISHSFLAGLLHDIGLIVLLQNEAARYQPMWQRSGGDESQLIRMEREAFDVTHSELGAVILMLWNLPGAIVQAVANSHSRFEDQTMSTLIDRAVMAAEWLLERRHPRDPDDPPSALADTPPASLQRWLAARDRILAPA